MFFKGGDYDGDKAFPGLALYHEGIDLIAIVSTGEDVWRLRVMGQLQNLTWNNIGIRWEPTDMTRPLEERGGLEVLLFWRQ